MHSKRGKGTSRRIWLIAAATVFVVAIVVGLALARDGSADTPARTGTRNDGASVTAEGTSSTVSPAGTAAPSVGERSDADDYRAAIVACNSEIAEQLDALTRQLVNAQYSESRWTEDTKSVLTRMARTAEQARRIEPTPEYEESHAVWLQGIESYDWVAKNMVTAIAVRDDELLMECSERLATASVTFQKATDLMSRVSVD